MSGTIFGRRVGRRQLLSLTHRINFYTRSWTQCGLQIDDGIIVTGYEQGWSSDSALKSETGTCKVTHTEPNCVFCNMIFRVMLLRYGVQFAPDDQGALIAHVEEILIFLHENGLEGIKRELEEGVSFKL